MATARYGKKRSSLPVALQQSISLLLQILLCTLMIRKTRCCTLGEGQRFLTAKLPYLPVSSLLLLAPLSSFLTASSPVLPGQHKLYAAFLILS